MQNVIAVLELKKIMVEPYDMYIDNLMEKGKLSKGWYQNVVKSKSLKVKKNKNVSQPRKRQAV